MKIWFVLGLLLYLCRHSHANIVFTSNNGYDFEAPSIFTTVYSEFHDCNACSMFYTANYKENEKIFVQVLVPAHQTDKINVIKIFGPAPNLENSKYEINHMLFSVGKVIYEVDAVANTNTSVILQITSASPHAHYAVTVGQTTQFNILNWTIYFAYLVQAVRYWMSTFVIYLIYIVLVFVYFVTWPFQRYKSYVIFPKLAIIAYIACILDTFYQYFYIIQYSSDYSILTFLVHIVPNITYIVVLLIVYETTIQKEVILISVCIVSLLIGGGGAYIGSLCLLIAYIGLFIMKGANKNKGKKILFCKV